MDAKVIENERTAKSQHATRQPDGPGKCFGKKGEISGIGKLVPGGASYRKLVETIRYLSLDKQKDRVLLAARVLLMILFLLFGWQKLTGFSDTVTYMASTGAPLPTLSALIAIAMECGAGILLVVGSCTRPLALLLALYTIGTAFIGHRYWTMAGPEQYASMINFYKNVSIVGGLLLLALTGPGKYSLDGK